MNRGTPIQLYPQCITCGKEKTTRRQQISKRCRSCATLEFNAQEAERRKSHTAPNLKKLSLSAAIRASKAARIKGVSYGDFENQ